MKSDKVVSNELHEEIRAAFDTLVANQSEAPDWHPKSNDTVMDLVHPSMYPLVYDRSKGFEEEMSNVDEAIYKWSGKGEVIKKDPYGRWDYRSNAYKGPGSATEPCWNDTYQWLPANIAFQENGTLKFTSYINNLHPQRYPGMYGTIEKMIEMALPAWDQCLVPAVAYPSRDEDSSGGAGRHCSRFEVPEDPKYVLLILIYVTDLLIILAATTILRTGSPLTQKKLKDSPTSALMGIRTTRSP